MLEKDLQSLLEQSGVCWFLDSGSLLGMIREGAFLKHDHDIDIGILSEGKEDQIDKFIAVMISKGFRAVKFFWGKVLYKCKLIPESSQIFPYIIDMQFYHASGSDFICPQLVFRDQLTAFQRIKLRWIRLRKSGAEGIESRKKSFKDSFKRVLRKIVTRKTIEIQYKKYSKMFDFYMWYIPKDYTDKFTNINGYQVFKDNENYLAYRYGDWKTPAKKWDFTKDDTGLKMTSYNYICDLYE
ncbi:MAG: LicD family protein [Firmicutes bacterium ADurb.Bin182]|nr:MAG: LicD family protein [Firmicutes bacterium ADurb.Bin182]